MSRTDYSAVDWTQPNSVIAKTLGVRNSNVANARRTHAPETIGIFQRGFPSRVDWSAVDWSRPTSALAAELGVPKSHVSFARRKYAPETVGRIRGPYSLTGGLARERWNTVDWSQSDIAIAAAFGVSRQAVNHQRQKRLQPDTYPAHSATSQWSLAEWRAAFRPRNCTVCGARIVPSERTRNPSVARMILTCSDSCKAKRLRAMRTPEQIAEESAGSAKRFRRWYADEGNRRKHIEKTIKAKSLRQSSPQ